MVGKLMKLFKKKLRIEVGSESGIEEELNRPTWKLWSQKRKKSLSVFGFKITLRW